MIEGPRDPSVQWIFGYGSLVWRPAFAHVEARSGFIRGWTRRFWQRSTDHRGVPGAPGRVATLVRDEPSRCWGRAYAVSFEELPQVLAQLDHREQQGYARAEVAVEFDDASSVTALMYVATPENPSFAGETPTSEIARIVQASHGPSGSNLEYVLRLAEALRSIGADDPHVFELERLCRPPK